MTQVNWSEPLRKCAACGWDSAKRDELRWNEVAAREFATPSIPVEALFGQRPEHTCPRGTTKDIVRDAINALHKYQLQPQSHRDALTAARKLVSELELLR